jgi:aminoglycoside 2'-N-acetyltransferase I
VPPAGALPDRLDVRRVATKDLGDRELAATRSLLLAAFPPGEGAFTEDDWQHSIGGQHFILERGGRIVAHASVVERELHIADRPVRTGYVEGVAAAPDRQGTGLGTQVMRAVTAYVRDEYELGALGTSSHHFYERLGWRTWQGPSFVRTDRGLVATPDEDGYILVLPTPSSPPLDFHAPISCPWRRGDVW